MKPRKNDLYETNDGAVCYLGKVENVHTGKVMAILKIFKHEKTVVMDMVDFLNNIETGTYVSANVEGEGE